MIYELTDRFEVPTSTDETWQFFSTAENLPAITLPWLAFRIDTPRPISIGQDAVLDYTVSWMKIPIRWRTLIIDWSPPRQFIDLQIRGPYTLWHHQHTFEPSATGVVCRDRVLYQVPGGPAGWVANQLMVKRQLLEIFRFRRAVIGERLGGLKALQADVQIRRV
jgi:hypothetical protein